MGSAAALALGGVFWKEVLNAAEGGQLRRGPGYGPLGAPDANGVRLPDGFSVRKIAQGRETVHGTGYRWHLNSDGAAIFPTRDGGWILVSNAEVDRGGASAIRFGSDGAIADAYPILQGSTRNCSGGPTPWGTWLSCEEAFGGRVWECDPAGKRRATVLPALGIFKHEAAAVDPHGRHVYLTEDIKDGRLYRFTPERWPSLAAGVLEVATVRRDRSVRWTEVRDPSGRTTDTRLQVPHSTPFARAEGIWFDSGTAYVATTLDSRVHAYDTRRQRIEVIYDGLAPGKTPLLRVDQLTGSRAGEIFVCEDIHTDEVHIGVITRDRKVSRFLAVTGPAHKNSELTGVAFAPAGDRMYFSSQYAYGRSGAIYEVRGPFRGRRA